MYLIFNIICIKKININTWMNNGRTINVYQISKQFDLNDFKIAKCVNHIIVVVIGRIYCRCLR